MKTYGFSALCWGVHKQQCLGLPSNFSSSLNECLFLYFWFTLFCLLLWAHCQTISPHPPQDPYQLLILSLQRSSSFPTPPPNTHHSLKKNYFRIILDLQKSCKEFPYTSPASFPIFTSYSTICHLPKLRNQHWYITLNSRLCFELFFHPYPQSIPRANSGYHTLHSMIVSQFFLVFHDF